MDMSADWKRFNEILFPNDLEFKKVQANVHQDPIANKRGSNLLAKIPTNISGVEKKKLERSAILIEEGDGVTSDMVFSDGKDTSQDQFNGAGFLEAEGVEKTLIVPRKDLNRALMEAVQIGPNYYRQIEILKEKLTKGHEDRWVISRSHFILDLFKGRLGSFLPKRFVFLIFIDGRTSLERFSFQQLNGIKTNKGHSTQIIALQVVNKKIESFFEPDFSNLSSDRLHQWENDYKLIGKYLESRYLMPCLGIYLFKDVWERLLIIDKDSNETPWKAFSQYLKQGRAKLYPNDLKSKLFLLWNRIF